MDEQLLVLGASARAAAFSALRAGLRPWCADLFADRDLVARCPTVRLASRYPHGFLDLLSSAPHGPWLYTGALENHPHLVGRIVACRPLWGVGPVAIRRARDPFFVRDALMTAGLRAPAVCHDGQAIAGAGPWLRKPLRGAGGAGIVPCLLPAKRQRGGTGGAYFQERIDGESCAALFVGNGTQARLLGLTRQLVGETWLHAAEFRYCGSLGPIDPGEALRRQLEALGDVLARTCGLRGLYGADGVLREGVFWPVEVNPRYTASVEVIELATGLLAIDCHRQACTSGELPPRPTPAFRCIGKAVLYAPVDFAFPADGPWMAQLRSLPPLDDPPTYADVPAAGELIHAGRPVLSFLVEGVSVAQCEQSLREIAVGLDRWLFGR